MAIKLSDGAMKYILKALEGSGKGLGSDWEHGPERTTASPGPFTKAMTERADAEARAERERRMADIERERMAAAKRFEEIELEKAKSKAEKFDEWAKSMEAPAKKPEPKDVWAMPGRAADLLREESIRDEELKKALSLLVQMAKKHGKPLLDPGVGRSLEERAASCLHQLDVAAAGVAMGGTMADKAKYCEGWTNTDTLALNAVLHGLGTKKVWSPTRPYGEPMKDDDTKKPVAIKGIAHDNIWMGEAAADIEAGLKPASEHAPEVELNELVEHQLMTTDPSYGAW